MRTSGTPAATLAARQPTDRFQFDSRSGPPPGAENSQACGSFPALHRSMIGTSSATSGTVRARWFFSVSTYSAPPPPLASTARLSRRPGPGTDTRSPTRRPAISPQRSPASARTGTTSRYGPVQAVVSACNSAKVSLPFPPAPAAGRPPDSCCHIVRDPAISHGEREDGAQRSQSTGGCRRGQATVNQAADPSRHLSGCDRGNWPVAETRPDVVTPVRLITL